MHFKLRIIKHSALGYILTLQFYKKTQFHKIFIKKISLTFCDQITEQHFNISADQFFFVFFLRFFRIGFKKAQMTKRSSHALLREEAQITKRSSHLSIFFRKEPQMNKRSEAEIYSYKCCPAQFYFKKQSMKMLNL